MDYAGYVLTGYVAAFGGLAAYAAYVVRRGKSASRQVPPERRRWSDAETR